MCACTEGAGTQPNIWAGAGSPAAGVCGSQCKPCLVRSDCDQGRSPGGYECFLPDMPNNRQVVQPAARADSDARLPSTHLSADDAGAEDDAGIVQERLHRSAPKQTGVCSNVCDTDLCTDPGMVCSSPTGFCHPGCDAKRPTCQANEFCDFSLNKQRCFDLRGQCDSADDCPIFDARLLGGLTVARGVVSCEDHLCRYTPNPPDLNVPVHTALALDTLPELRVDSPQPGHRILPSELPSFQFQFSAPVQAIVATILTREPKSLEDGASAAVWTAYLDGKQALNGVTLEQGGTMKNGAWQSYLGPLTLPYETQLYFLVVGYSRGERVAQSKLVPFSIGARRPKAGDLCSGKDGEFCAKDSALLCMSYVCRTPCLSDADCASVGQGACFEPNWLNVKARVCR